MAWPCLADYGRFLEIGKRDIYENTRLGLQPFRKNLSFFAIDLDRVIRERPALLGSLLQDIVQRSGATASSSRCPTAPGRSPMRSTPSASCSRPSTSARSCSRCATGRSRSSPRRTSRSTFRADASYLITGGLGGFGLAVARWMAEPRCRQPGAAGATRRRHPRGPAAVAELEQLGARVVVRAGDVSQAEDVAAVLAEIDRDAAAAPRRCARGDGPGGRPAAQPRPRPDRPGAGPEGERDVEPARADASAGRWISS